MKQVRSIIAGMVVLALSASMSLAQTNPGSSPLTPSKGGTNSAFVGFTGPASTVKTFILPNANSTLAALGQIQTWTGAQSFGDGKLIVLGSSSGSTTIKAPATAGGTATIFTGTDTFLGRATTDTLTNKTIDTAGVGNSFSINGLAATANTGTGSVVRATSPALVTPTLGAATATTINGNSFTSGTYTLTGAAAKTLTFNNTLTLAGVDATTLTFQGTDTYVGRTTTDTLTNKTLTAPTLTTPALGVATATSINKVAVTAPATNATLTIPDGVTLTGPASSGVAVTLGNTETVTGVKTFGSAGSVGRLKVAGTTSGSTVLDATSVASGTLTLPATTDTLVGKATTDVLTNKTLDSAGTGNVLKVGGVTVSAGQYPGTATNDNATAGNVGEYKNTNVLVASAVSLTNNTAANLASISLPAGDWLVSAIALANPAATTNMTLLELSLSTTTATRNLASPNVSQLGNIGVPGGNYQPTCVIAPVRFSLASTTTVFAVVLSSFTVSTNAVFGQISAVRIR